MQNEHGHSLAKALKWRVGVLAFCITVGIGSVCTIWALQQLQASTQQQARHAAQALAHSVAQTLSQQIARAIRIGIPPQQIPGLDAYLQRALDQAPGLAYIALRAPDNTSFSSTVVRPANDEIRADVQVHGQTAAIVAVGTAPANLIHGITLIQSIAGMLVFCMGLLSAWLALRGPGQQLECQYRQLAAGLQGVKPSHPLRLYHSNDALQQALDILAERQQQRQEQEAMLHSYVQELLAVDFDHRMQLQISKIMASGEEIPHKPDVSNRDI